MRKNDPLRVTEFQENFKLDTFARAIELAMSGLSIREISKRLGIIYSCVLRHKEKMLLPNECNSMLELIAKYHGTNPNRQL